VAIKDCQNRVASWICKEPATEASGFERHAWPGMFPSTEAML
jgi:hypothetical protein